MKQTVHPIAEEEFQVPNIIIYERIVIPLFPTSDHHIELMVNATRLALSGSWVNVSWSGVSNPKKSDWIGVYSPPIDNTIDPSYNAPVKYQV